MDIRVLRVNVTAGRVACIFLVDQASLAFLFHWVAAVKQQAANNTHNTNNFGASCPMQFFLFGFFHLFEGRRRQA